MNEKDSLTIKAIDKNVVNQICSGQVILSLATAIKELVENSIDAGATSIQIRLKEYGSEMIEVSDNGLGVQENNFQALTLKHYTSKISNFTDVALVETFGFRGEALSSLCTLSKVSIVTKHKDSLTGTKLKFDHNGIITESSKIARQTGTTVTLENIFYTLPVRHKEFLRNIKKEFTKMCHVLYAYGVLSKGISIICTNQVSNKKMTVMETKGDTIKSNIVQIFGSKQSQHLLELKESLPDDIQDDDSTLEQSIIKLKSEEDIKLEGFVSSCVHGCGRSSSDRQFYYINSRPVDNIKVMKLVNDIYHQYNPHQYPFIVMNVKILMKYIDVNVTPDKRLIFMKNENLLLSTIKASLHNIFKTIPAVLEMQNVGLMFSKADPPLNEENGDKKTEFLTSLEKLKEFKSNFSPSHDSKNKDMSVTNRKLKKHRLFDDAIAKEKFSQKVQSSFFSKFCTLYQNMRFDKNEELNSDSQKFFNTNEYSEKKIKISHHLEKASTSESQDSSEQKPNTEDKILTIHKRKAADGMKCRTVEFQKETAFSDAENFSEDKNLKTMKRLKTDDGLSETFKKNRKTLAFTVSFSDMQKLITNYVVKRSQNNCQSNSDNLIRFYSEINPQKNDVAEKELKKELTKESFKRMNIIGQFNLGFIITNLAADIFIIDQHASDEKYNFETLQLNTKIQTQKLVIPQNLNLTIEKEEIFLQHSEIIRKNGFDFTFDHNCNPTNRIKLVSIPLSRNWVFGKEDIDELLFILENSPGEMCRPSRVRDMFASRACRKSVMIGTALNNCEMRRIVNHMGEIEQPWNCPHGRPTIRHLINLNMIKQS